jgi:hypothetical protein
MEIVVNAEINFNLFVRKLWPIVFLDSVIDNLSMINLFFISLQLNLVFLSRV